MKRAGTRLLIVASSFLALVVAFAFVARPLFLNWGATDEEIAQSLPGDEIIPGAVYQQTRAITIDAPADRVWPWLAQLGQDRGGFYSYDLVENLVGCEMPTSDYLRPDKQSWKPGDRLWMYPPRKAGGVGFGTLRTYAPGRALGFATRAVGTPLDAPEDGSWSFILLPIDRQRTRFVVRGRSLRPTSPGPPAVARVLDRIVFEPMHYAMERRMMIGLARLAEGKDRGRLANHLQVVEWMAMLVVFALAGAMVVRRAYWRRPLAVFIGSALVFQLLTLVQPEPISGGALVLVLIAASGVFRSRRMENPDALASTQKVMS